MMPNDQTEALGLSDLAATGAIAALAAERDAGVGLKAATVEYQVATGNRASAGGHHRRNGQRVKGFVKNDNQCCAKPHPT
jgi:hypothetical protein